MAEHTRDPWSIDEYESTILVRGKTDHRGVFRIVWCAEDPDDEDRANARLIASAPVGFELAALVLRTRGLPPEVTEVARKFMDQAGDSH